MGEIHDVVRNDTNMVERKLTFCCNIAPIIYPMEHCVFHYGLAVNVSADYIGHCFGSDAPSKKTTHIKFTFPIIQPISYGLWKNKFVEKLCENCLYCIGTWFLFASILSGCHRVHRIESPSGRFLLLLCVIHSICVWWPIIKNRYQDANANSSECVTWHS